MVGTAHARLCLAYALPPRRQPGLFHGACHRARVRATRWLLAMTTILELSLRFNVLPATRGRLWTIATHQAQLPPARTIRLQAENKSSDARGHQRRAAKKETNGSFRWLFRVVVFYWAAPEHWAPHHFLLFPLTPLPNPNRSRSAAWLRSPGRPRRRRKDLIAASIS